MNDYGRVTDGTEYQNAITWGKGPGRTKLTQISTQVAPAWIGGAQASWLENRGGARVSRFQKKVSGLPQEGREGF